MLCELEKEELKMNKFDITKYSNNFNLFFNIKTFVFIIMAKKRP